MSNRDNGLRVDRRRFVSMTAGAGLLGATGLSFLTGCEQEPATGIQASPMGAARPGTSRPRNPLYLPATVGATGLVLTAAPGAADLGGGQTSNVLQYNGSFPGPTIRAYRGSSASVTLVNGLSQETITHWHGMVVDHANDGHPRQAIAPGATKGYSFDINQRACLNWYHPHPHMLTGEQVALGLAGAFIVNDAEEVALALPAGAREVPLIIRDTRLDKRGNLQYMRKRGGFLGNVPLVNGTRDPELLVHRGVYRLRILNGANARIFGLALANGAPFVLIGNDGGLLEFPVSLTRIDLAPAERVDVLVDFSGLGANQTVMLRDALAGWDLLQFKGTGTAAGGSIPTGRLSTISPLPAEARSRLFSFDGMSRINGQEYALDRIDFQVPFGDVERWVFTTNGNAPHPVHVHGASFQVVSRTGGRGQLYPWEAGWKDTVLLEDGETVEVKVRFDAFRGVYLMHCHKLEHEDMGMMANFEVV